MDVCSGAIHVVDDVTYDVIALYEEKSLEEIENELSYSKEDIEEAYKEVTSLKEEGLLFTEDIYEDYIKEVKSRKTVVKALCLHIAHDCNLACRYCFAEEGEYKGHRELMSAKVGKAALDFLVANSGNRHNLEVDFFGGEPTMNFGVVKEVVEYGRSLEEKHNKHFRFTLTTNGVLLNDEIMEFANKEMDNVVLSVDGRKEIHDYMRPTRNGKPSYDLIMPKFIRFAESRHQQKYYVRGTFTNRNLDFSKDVLHLADLGFEQISMEPVVGQPEEPYAIQEKDLPQIFDEYDRLAKEMIKREKAGKGFNFFHFMIDLTGGPCVAKRLSGCGSGTEYLAVTPWGDLYPCHQFVGEEKFLLGNVFDGIKRTDICDEFRSCNVYTKKKCKDCFARFYCSGGCPANSYNFHGTIDDSYDLSCDMERKRVECAIMIKAALADTEGEEEQMEKWFIASKRADFNKIGEIFHISPVTARLMRNRSLTTVREMQRYLYGSLSDLYDSHLLKDADKGAEIIKEKIETGKKIRIISDYDVDGVSSNYILYQGLKRCGADVDYKIPDRVEDGYGINEHLIEKAAGDGINTIITCDNGIAAAEQIAYGNSLGLTLIVTDHHDIPFQRQEDGSISYNLPSAAAVINPKQKDCPYPFENICGCCLQVYSGALRFVWN